MTLSFWRYSHLLLAAISSIFLVLASVTGAILAFEPISNSLQPYAVADIDKIMISDVIGVLQEEYGEVLEIRLTSADFVIASVITEEGHGEEIYVNPITGEKQGVVEGKSPFFAFMTNLHRSLFLKSIGRFFVGLISLLLCFITITGIFLLIQRQGGVRKLFFRIKKTDFAQRYHIIFGKYFFIPILIVAVTGVYLSLEKFSILPPTAIQHNWNALPTSEGARILVSDFEIFKHTPLKELRSLSFPFSEDQEDYYQVALADSALLIHQYTGEVISEIAYPFTRMVSSLSLELHTGKGSVLWSLVLFLASVSILFFIYSGFVMFFKRQKKSKNSALEFSHGDSEFIILVGSETGNTFEVAKAFYKALIGVGKTVFLSTLNQYRDYKSAKHLIVFTATYGDGDAPNNARKFEQLLHTVIPARPMQFAVLGFGSQDYPNYCHFAIKVDALLHNHPIYEPVLPLIKVNEQSSIAIAEWGRQWSDSVGIPLFLESPSTQKRRKKKQSFKVVKRTDLNVDDTFLLELRPSNRLKFRSGDLLAVLTAGENRERLYSIARKENNVLLSVKKHEKGICSSYLYNVSVGEEILGSIATNKKFHAPQKASSIVLIANGTGIGPFLGIVSENNRQTPIHLFWGGRTQASVQLYREQLNRAISRKQLKGYKVAYSRETSKQYVQDLLMEEETFIAKVFSEGGVFMICGSLKMQDGVLAILEGICERHLGKDLNQFENKGQLLMDCY